MKYLLLSFLFLTSSVFASDYSEYRELLNEYNDCVRTSQVFSGGSECIKPIDIPGYNSQVVYENGVLHLSDAIIIKCDDITELSYVKMLLVDGVFVVDEIIK